MKVKDLIKKLQHLDPDSTVCLGEEVLLQKETSCHYREYYKTKTEFNFIHKNIFINSNEDIYINNTNCYGNSFSSKEKLKKLLNCWQNDLKERKKMHKERYRENAYYSYKEHLFLFGFFDNSFYRVYYNTNGIILCK